MIDRHQETLEFEAKVAQMRERLAKIGVTVEKADYAAEAFGSWHIVAGNKDGKVYFSYEGKESYLRYRDAAIVPKDYRDFQHKTIRTWDGEDPLAYVEEVLTRESPQK